MSEHRFPLAPNTPEDQLAFYLSELLNDDAPLGWERYRSAARLILQDGSVARQLLAADLPRPRLLYYEDAYSAWVLAPERVDGIISIDHFSSDDDPPIEIRFKRQTLTDSQIDAWPEV